MEALAASAERVPATGLESELGKQLVLAVGRLPRGWKSAPFITLPWGGKLAPGSEIPAQKWTRPGIGVAGYRAT